MAFTDLFKVYPNKNFELAAIAKVAYEMGLTIAAEPSAAMSIGLDEHAIKRQRSYVTKIKGMIEAIHGRPIPDMPYVHPTRVDIDFSTAYTTFTKDGLALNEETTLLAQYWLILGVELAASQSAGLAGSLIDPDYDRVTNHVAVIEQYLTEIEARPVIDLPETAYPAAILEVPSDVKKTK
jgi:hypothetical protein